MRKLNNYKFRTLLLLFIATSCNGSEKTNFTLDNIKERKEVHIEQLRNIAPWNNAKLLVSYILNEGRQLSNLPNGVIHSMFEDKIGNIWFGTWNGLYRFNIIRKNHPCNNHTCKHLFSNSQDLYFHNKEVSKSYDSFTYNNDINDVHVNSIIEDNDGNIWFGTSNVGIGFYDNNCKNKIKYITESNGINSNYISSLLKDKNGNIWIGTNAGVCIFNGNSFVKFTTKDGLVDNLVTSIMEDTYGKIWFGTNGGVSIYDGKVFTNFDQKYASNFKNVKSLIQDKNGNIWAGGSDGAICFDGEKVNQFNTQNGLSHSVVSNIFEDNLGNIWFAVCDNDLTGGGICKFDGKSFKSFTKKDGLISNKMFCFLIDKYKNFWLGSSQGVSNLYGVPFVNSIFNIDDAGC